MVKQVKDLVTPGSSFYNSKAAKAKTALSFEGAQSEEVKFASKEQLQSSDLSSKLAHSGDKMSCFTCHSSWVTSCAGCHLPIQANWKKDSNHYDGKETRNWASYNPQVARDDMFQIGKHGPAKDGKIVPIRSSSAWISGTYRASNLGIVASQFLVSFPS